MAKRVLIVNPNARGGFAKNKWPVLEPVLRDALGSIEVMFTKQSGDGTRLAEEAVASGAESVIAMGGDGTASEVAAGLLAAFLKQARSEPTCSFGYLPCATGGDFRRILGTPTDLREAAEAIARAKPRPIDAGQIDFIGHDGQPRRSFFINVASCGISGLVDHFVNEGSKALGGTATFFLASLRATFQYKNVLVRVKLDDEPSYEQRIYTLAVANGGYFGGGMNIAPDAKLDDGWFDVTTLGDLSVLEALKLSGLIYKGQQGRMSKVSMKKARRIVVEPVDSEQKVLLDTDGETPGRLPATFTLLPAALSFLSDKTAR
ncbi:MAG TPA: diacylglycerol kinase family lipid kinase [Pseudomonadota bacterium]|nr:diacylglycerol kinase family lipid kinase [Pseudomonadota bacterium]